MSQHFAPDPVHDLRVALRRCRSMADGMMSIDPYPGWKQMKKAGRQLFRALGDLRDLQVMVEWIPKLGMQENSAGAKLLEFAEGQEHSQKQAALVALNGFDRKQWEVWTGTLGERASRVPLDSTIFLHLALERWHAAHELHRQALRNRTKAGYHRLRIGIKRFRYTVENFLPTLHRVWEEDLKEIQDTLGEIHDLDVLWKTAMQLKAFDGQDSGPLWHARLEHERGHRLERYRNTMMGKDSRWGVWRAALPEASQVEAGALERLERWASFSDPDFAHTKDSARLALQLYDGVVSDGSARSDCDASTRATLRIAAVLRNVGRARRAKKYHKHSYRLISRLSPPLGLSAENHELAALVVRYHRGGLPRPEHRRFAALPNKRKRVLLLLAGILRLSDAFDRLSAGRIRSLMVDNAGNCIAVRLQGNLRDSSAWEKIATARYLLEVACDRPVLVKTGERLRVHHRR